MNNKSFNLEQALAGEPVKLRNGLKAYVKYIMPEQYKGDYPLRGFLLNLKGNVSETAWTMGGVYSILEENNNLDIISMWEEPRPKVTLTLPCPLKEPQEEMWYILGDGVVRSDSYSLSLLNVGKYFATKQDAEEWLNAMKGSRR